jgi:hypothetical protein
MHAKSQNKMFMGYLGRVRVILEPIIEVGNLFGIEALEPLVGWAPLLGVSLLATMNGKGKK